MYGAMYGDFSRLTFDRERGYSAVVAFQGRVNVEADANEQSQILLHYLRTLATDLLGPAAWPAASPTAFQISFAGDGLVIGRGRCYVDGILVENEVVRAEDDAGPTPYFAQPHAFVDSDRDAVPQPPYWVYLKVWERLLTGEDFPAIRDVALGDQIADSSGRLQVVWQVVVADAGSKGATRPADREEALARFEQDFRPSLEPPAGDRGVLRAWATEPPEDDLCATSPRAHFLGLENQLYRVEIHRGGQATGSGEEGTDSDDGRPTFKWSRDNGSVVFPVVEVNGPRITVSTLGRDDRYALEVGDWVEVVDDAYALAPDRERDDRGPLFRVELVDPADFVVTLDRAPEGVGSDPALHPLLRVWDHQETAGSTGWGIPFGADEEFELEDGVRVAFGRGAYRSGDYWVIPARVESGDVEWPRSAGDDGGEGEALWRQPHGVDYHYAPLAFVGGPEDVIDLRCVFNPQCAPPAEPSLREPEEPVATPPAEKAQDRDVEKIETRKPSARKPSGRTGKTPRPRKPPVQDTERNERNELAGRRTKSEEEIRRDREASREHPDSQGDER